VKRYAELGSAARDALAAYCREVRDGSFPGPEHAFR
jgi:3-methyl-2-oxobutanoate hydroxymethyltransferase